jgi:hypothetical protein
MSNIEDETAILQFEFDEKVFIYGTITDSGLMNMKKWLI